MRFAFSLSLAAIGVSFLLPSDGLKAALFLICSAVAYLFMEEQDELEFAGYPESASSGHPESTGEVAPVFADDESDTYRVNDSDSYD